MHEKFGIWLKIDSHIGKKYPSLNRLSKSELSKSFGTFGTFGTFGLTQKMQNIFPCIVVHIAAAVYSCGDTITFEILQDIPGQLYLRVILQYEEIMEDVCVFNWDQIPTEVRDIYEYVNANSSMRNGILFGTHILRKDNRNYALAKMSENPIGQTREIMDTVPYNNTESLKRLARQMKTVKNIA